MMHATSESDVTSIAPSLSPPVYYVQSPSRDSQDEADKCSSSMHVAIPTYHSATDSPSHPSSFARNSMTSTSASRVSGNWRSSRRNNRRSWQQCKMIEEDLEGEYDLDFYGKRMNSKHYKFLIFLVAFGFLFGGLCLVMWGASRPYRAHVSVKSLRVHSFYWGEGSDHTGVPTKFLTVNCSATMLIYNPARFFGIHVHADHVCLFLSDLTIACGQLRKYYQTRQSLRTMSVSLDAQRVPLYGAGVALAASDKNGGVPFKLEFDVQTRGYLVGKLVKTKHKTHISCSLVINSTINNDILLKHDSCSYG